MEVAGARRVILDISLTLFLIGLAFFRGILEIVIRIRDLTG